MEHKLQFDFLTTQKMIQKIGKIDQFKGEWKQLDNTENRYLKELRRIATIQSIGSSTRIEGSTMTDLEVASLLKNLKIKQLQTRDEQEVGGYFDTLETIIDSYADIDLTVSTIHALHNLLLRYSAKDERHRGRFKELNNQIVANYPDGTTRIIFKATEPFLVEKEMTEIIEWVNKKISDAEIHPLLMIGVFIYEFLSIHPYQDGNGRLSRLLTNLLLMKLDYKFVLYVSLESIIETQKANYYQALMSGQRNRYKTNEQIDEWILFFLTSLETLIAKLQQKLKEFQDLGGYKNERQKEVLAFIATNQPLKMSDIIKKFPQYSAPILRKDLQYLVRELEVEKIGHNKATIYKINHDKKATY
jgi:Fic family protein